MNDFERRIRTMFGLGERNLTPKEKKCLSTWIYEYQYDIEIVEMAYNITVDTKGTPNMSYTNGILKNWYEDGLTTKDAIIAKREAENSAVKAIREGDLTPDSVTAAVESILNTEPRGSAAPHPGNAAKDLNILRRLLNLGNRMLTDGETVAFTRWRAEFGFRYEIIYYAYQITLENRREYHLPYMAAILSKWHAQNLTTMEAIRVYDKGFKENKERAKQRAGAKAPINAPQQNSSYDTNDFFMAAVKRSLGEDFDPSVLDQ
jgi:DnaD/phage-associated family protein